MSTARMMLLTITYLLLLCGCGYWLLFDECSTVYGLNDSQCHASTINLIINDDLRTHSRSLVGDYE